MLSWELNKWGHSENSSKSKYEQAVQSLGKAIKTQRKKLGLSQTELSYLAGVSLNLVSQVEAGKTTAHISKVLDILHAMGLRLTLELGKERIHVKDLN